MRLAIDATPVLARRKGIGVVLDGLISAAPEGSAIATAVVFVDESFASEASAKWPGCDVRPVKMRSSLVWETKDLPKAVAVEKIDVLLTARDRTVVGGAAKSVVWLFEIPDHRVSLLTKASAPIHRKLISLASLSRFRRIAKRVTHFVVSSDFTRNDLIQRYDIPHERITLIYPGIPDVYRGARPASAIPYVLHFATGDLRDNSDLALRAFAKAVQGVNDNIRLVLAGVPDDSKESMRKRARELGIESRIDIRGYIPADEMPGLFGGARVYFDPTLFEGFGLQLLEAMAAGAAVITSNNSSAAEVVSDAGLTAESGDETAFASALRLLLTDDNMRQRYSALGRARASSFTWGASVAAFEKLFKAISDAD